MYQSNLDKRSLRSALLLGAASAAAVGVSMPAYAQEDQSVSTVVVTGSRIPQTGLYSPSPVTAVGQQEFKFEGTTDTVNLLNSLPSVFIDQSDEANNGATGTSDIDLRGLGAKRTLVLVDGTRLMPGDPGFPVADINTIPAAMIDHVEILTGGASAVYGSDAVAGVVNFIMRKDFQGIEFDGQYSAYEDDNNNGYAQGLFNKAQFPTYPAGGVQVAPSGNVVDGEGESFSLILGTNTENDKGNVTGYFGYRHQTEVLQNSRDYSACELVSTGPNGRTCAGSPTYSLFLSLDNYETGNVHVGSGTYFGTGNGTVGSGKFAAFTGAPNQYFNFAHYQIAQRPDQRYNGGFFAHYEVNKELEVYSSFMFTDDQTLGQLGPSGVFDGTGPVSGGFLVNCSNPYLTTQENQILCGQVPGDVFHAAGSNATAIALGHGYWGGEGNLTAGQSSLIIARRNVEGGPRQYSQEHESFRLQGGIKGDLGNHWSYDVYAQLGYTSFTEYEGGQVSRNAVINALQVTPTTPGNGICTSGASGCVPLNIFDGIGSITPAMEGYIEVPGLEQGWTKEEIASGALTGDLGAWGGKSPWAKNPIGVSIGAEYREESLNFQPDLEDETGDLEGGGEAVPENGAYNVEEAFTEVKIPIIEDAAWAEDLTANAGYRYSSYDTGVTANTWKAGLEWQPIDDIRFRASEDRALRAPNILELFTSQSVGLYSGQNPCWKAATGSSTYNNCAAFYGVHSPAISNGTTYNQNSILLSCAASQCDELGGGNPHLKPEIATTRSVGAVLTPRFLDGFTATVDYFDIYLDNAIGSISPVLITSECFVYNISSYCALIHPTAQGSISSNTGTTATSGYVAATNLNLGWLKTQGFDWEWNYNADLANWGAANSGSLAFNFVATYMTNDSSEPIPGLPPPSGNVHNTLDCAGLYGDVCGNPTPRWRHKLRVTWESPWDFNISAQWRFLSGVALDANRTSSELTGAASVIDGTIPNYSYFDLVGDWTIREGVDVRLGVNNILDHRPPIISDSYTPLPATGNTFPGTYDLLGRYMFAAVTIKY